MRVLVNLRWIAFLLSAFFITTAKAAPGDKIDLVRDLAGRVGPIIGSALACPDITRPRIQSVIEKFAAVIRDVASNETQRSDLAQLFDRSVADGRNAVASGRTDCRLSERRLADLEQSLTPIDPRRLRPPPPAAPAFAAAPAPAVSFGNPVSAVRGISDNEIRFGITAAFTGPVRERGRQMKLGIDTAFNRVNETGGLGGPDAAADCRRRWQRADAHAPGRETALREGPDLRPHRQHRHRDRSGRGALRAGASDAVLRSLHRRQCRAPRSSGSLCLQLPAELCRGSRRRGALSGEDAPHPGAADRRVRPAGRSRRCRVCRRRQGVSRARYQRQRHPAAQLPAQHHRGRRGRQPVETAKAAGQGDHHVGLLSGRRQIHREDAQPLSRNDLHQHLGRRRHSRSPTS